MKENTLKDIYDSIYLNTEKYNFYDEMKNCVVDLFCSTVNGRVLDVGCGEGIHLKRINSKGVDAFGIELSTVCCQKYLQTTPHKNIDILSFSKERDIFEGAICMDVLEHIPYSEINENIEAIKKIIDPQKGQVLFCIANHSDVQQGEELHLIQENYQWWSSKLSASFPFVHYLGQQFGGRCFYFVCAVSERFESSVQFTLISEAISRLLEINQKKENLITEYLGTIHQLQQELQQLAVQQETLGDKLAFLTTKMTLLKEEMKIQKNS